MRLHETLSLVEAIKVPGAGEADQTATDLGEAAGSIQDRILHLGGVRSSSNATAEAG